MEQAEAEQPLKIPGPCPFLTRPTLVNGKVRDLSLTDFKGKFLFVLFYQEDFKSVEDVKALSKNQKVFKQSDCEVLACSTESSLVHLNWVRTAKEDGGFGGRLDIPLMSDKLGDLSRKLDIYDDEEGILLEKYPYYR